MSGGEGVGDVIQLHLDPVEDTRLERLRRLVTVAMGQIEQPVGHQGRGAVGLYVVQPDREQRVRLVGREIELHDRGAQDLGARGERRGVEDERPAVFGTLVERHLALGAKRAPFAGAQARRLWGRKGQRDPPSGSAVEPARA